MCICLSVCLSVCLDALCVWVCLFVSLCMHTWSCVSVCLCPCKSVLVFVCLCAPVSVRLCVCVKRHQKHFSAQPTSRAVLAYARVTSRVFVGYVAHLIRHEADLLVLWLVHITACQVCGAASTVALSHTNRAQPNANTTLKVTQSCIDFLQHVSTFEIPLQMIKQPN